MAKRPDNDTMLQLYALYKQATVSDVGGKRPCGFDVVGQATHDAETKRKGITGTVAMP